MRPLDHRLNLVGLLVVALLGMLAPTLSRAQATAFGSFVPLPAPAVTGSLPASAPFLLADPSWLQQSLADRSTQLNAGQFNSGAWDMIDLNRSGAEVGRYLFMPFETGPTGLQRFDRQTGTAVTLWSSAGAFGLDGLRWSPWGTVVTGEEDWGAQPNPHGRLFELTNPTTAVAGGGTVVHRNSVARVEHEGLVFDSARRLYYVDEHNGGAIYRYESATPGSGATFFDGGINAVLRVGDGSVAGATGAASWVPFTDAAGVGLPGAVTILDPNGIAAVDGRATTALAAFRGTGFNRPEDLDIRTLPDGTQVLYFSATDAHRVYALNLSTLVLKEFVNRDTLDAATGLAVGAAFANPDNLAIDAAGNLHIVEDSGNGRNNIWLARDADGDGVADSLARWASLSAPGAEPTGLVFDPLDPDVAFVNVQHPASGVDRLMQITAVPELPAALQALAGLALLAALARVRGRSARR